MCGIESGYTNSVSGRSTSWALLPTPRMVAMAGLANLMISFWCTQIASGLSSTSNR